MPKHLVLFDGECAFCNRSVRHLLQIDRTHCLVFAPLQGKTAQEILVGSRASLRNSDSLVLVENYRSSPRHFWIRSQAVLRIYWLIGGVWKVPGLFSFLPSFLGDFVYRFVARNRHRIGSSLQELPSDRLLP